MLVLKGNQGDLSDKVNMLFEYTNMPLDEQTTEDVDIGHGRIETRRCRQLQICRTNVVLRRAAHSSSGNSPTNPNRIR